MCISASFGKPANDPTHRLSRTTVLIALALLACAILFFVGPGTAHAAPLQLPLPGWLQVFLDWGIAIQAYLLNAPVIYTELKTWRLCPAICLA
jgi:uncharacterized protein (DUF486 family)